MPNDCYAIPYFGIASFGSAVPGGDCRDRVGASALSQVSIFSPGWRGETRVSAAGIQASWTINGPGKLSCLIPASTAPRIRDLKGLWLYWEHPTMGPWAGTIEDTPDDLGGGTWEISGVSMAGMLARRRSPRTDLPTRAQAGALARMALRFAEQPARLWFDSTIFEENGAQYTVQWKGDTVLTVFSGLVQASLQEWRVTTAADRTTKLEWRVKVGVDRRNSVLIADGYTIGGGRLESSIATLENDRLVVSGSGPWQRREATNVTDKASILLYERRQGKAYAAPDRIKRASLRAAAKASLRSLAIPVQPFSIDLAADNALGYRNIPLTVREGDTVRVWRANQPNPFDFRVTTRSVDVSAGKVTLTGDATTGATTWDPYG